MSEKTYQLEMRFSIVECDEHGRSNYNNRFELNDTQKLGAMPMQQLLSIMAGLHAAFSNIAAITAGQNDAREQL